MWSEICLKEAILFGFICDIVFNVLLEGIICTNLMMCPNNIDLDGMSLDYMSTIQINLTELRYLTVFRLSKYKLTQEGIQK